MRSLPLGGRQRKARPIGGKKKRVKNQRERGEAEDGGRRQREKRGDHRRRALNS